MAFKRVGGLEIDGRRIGRFLGYCEHCNQKFILSDREARELIEKFGHRYYKSQHIHRRALRKSLTYLLEKV